MTLNSGINLRMPLRKKPKPALEILYPPCSTLKCPSKWTKTALWKPFSICHQPCHRATPETGFWNRPPSPSSTHTWGRRQHVAHSRGAILSRSCPSAQPESECSALHFGDFCTAQLTWCTALPLLFCCCQRYPPLADAKRGAATGLQGGASPQEDLNVPAWPQSCPGAAPGYHSGLFLTLPISLQSLRFCCIKCLAPRPPP